MKSYFQRYILIAIWLLATTALAHGFSTESYAGSSRLAEGKWVKVSIDESGIYRITPDNLRQWGFSDINAVRVFGYGGAPISDVLSAENTVDDLPQVPVLRTTGGLLFYGQGVTTTKRIANEGMQLLQVQHPYATKACYFITENAAIEAAELKPEERTAQGGAPLTSFIDYVFHEQELVTPGQTGRLLLGEDFRYSTSQNFNFDLTDIVAGSTVYAQTSFGAKIINGSGRLAYKYNGNSLEWGGGDGIRGITSVAYEHVRMTTGVKSFTLDDSKLSYNVSLTYSGTLFTARLDYITINYERQLRLAGNQLTFRSAAAKDMALSNAGANTHVLDVTTPWNVEEVAVALNGATVTIPGTSGDRTYVAFNDNASFPSPAKVEDVVNQNLHATEIPDMVIITPPEFHTQAQRIADRHAADDGFTTLVVNPRAIYNEFSSGTVDYNAFRRMLKMFYDRDDATNRKLRYLLMLGRPSYDNREITDAVKRDSYPRLIIWESDNGDNENTSYCTDDLLAMLEDGAGMNMAADKICLSIGRMPVKSADEAKAMVDKLFTYMDNKDTGMWKNNVLMIADDEDSGIHMSQGEEFIKIAKDNGGEPYLYTRVYQDAYTAESAGSGRVYPQARADMYGKLAEGVLWAHYIGHANPSSWTADGLLTSSDVAQQMFYTHLPMLYTATCEYTRYDADNLSGGELMWLNTQGGVIALITTARVVFISDNGVLARQVAAHVFERDADGAFLRIGDILTRGKNDYNRSNENKLRYTVIGDPAMRLNYPKYSITVDEINGEVPDQLDNDITIQARQSVEIAGTIYDASGAEATDFNGYVIPKIYDAETSVTTHGYGDGTEYVYYDRNNLLVLTQEPVTGGKFRFTVKMPSEISNNWSPALLNLYAVTTDGLEANGSNEKFYVYGYDETAIEDTKGPDVEYFVLNSSNFKDGDNVNESPLVMAAFSDESGINLSSAGVGHQMMLTLDETTSYTDIAQHYVPAEGGQGGAIKYQLSDLAAGNHSLRLRVWDNANNSTSTTINFNVVPGLTPELVDVYTSANPAKETASFYVVHDRPDATMTVTIEVYNLMGRLVWSSTQTGKSDMFTTFPVQWNLTDMAGRRVSRGIYIYRASVESNGKRQSTKGKKIAVAAE